MQAVTLYIMDVIETVNAAGDKAEGHKSPECLYEILLVQQVVAEEQWGEYEGILKPLQGAQKHQSIFHWVQRYN